MPSTVLHDSTEEDLRLSIKKTSKVDSPQVDL